MSSDFNYAAPSSGCQTYLPVFRVRKRDQDHLLNIIRRKTPMQLFIFHRPREIILSINNGSLLQFYQK